MIESSLASDVVITPAAAIAPMRIAETKPVLIVTSDLIFKMVDKDEIAHQFCYWQFDSPVPLALCSDPLISFSIDQVVRVDLSYRRGAVLLSL